MAALQKVAIFGASGNFGTPITAALQAAGFTVTVITRVDSPSVFPPDLPVLRTAYTTEALTAALAGQDAVVCVVGPAGVHLQTAMIDAAAAAGVSRFIVDDFGWGPTARGMPELMEINDKRRAQWDHARVAAEGTKGFSWTGVSTGNPIDWALHRFPMMGFEAATNTAVLYDDGTETFTGTTLEGIGQAVVGVLQRPEETANRFVRVLSIDTCQSELLAAFEAVTGRPWTVQRSTIAALLEDARARLREGKGGWILPLAVSQLFDPGEARGRVADSREASESDLVGVRSESAEEIARKVLARVGAV